jgi:hypothetical protein
MKTIRFLLEKIVIVEVMLLVLYFATVTFNIHIVTFDLIIITILKYLTPIAIICLIPYIIFSIFDNEIIDIAIGIVIGGLILKYLGVI